MIKSPLYRSTTLASFGSRSAALSALAAPCLVLLALAAACGDSASDQTQTGAQASGGTAATAGKSAPAAIGGNSAGAGSSGHPMTGNNTPPTAAAGTPGSAGQSPSGSAGVPASGSAAGSGGASTTAAAGSPAAAGGAAPAAGASGSAGAAGTASTDCDRACLLGVMEKYLDAVIAHDPSKAPISSSVKMTDNGMTAKPGDGLWKTGTELVKDARLDYADPVTKNVGSQCLINEGSSPAMYEVRLKVEDGQITEIESMTVRRQGAANGFFSPQNLKPEAVFLKMPEASEKMTREQLMTTMNLYLDYLEGKKSGDQVPFDEMCKRYENGVATASGLSSFMLQSWSFQVTRRILIIDEEMQIVWGMFPFMQSSSALVVGEAFKMLGGKIMMIQAVMANMPAKAWD